MNNLICTNRFRFNRPIRLKQRINSLSFPTLLLFFPTTASVRIITLNATLLCNLSLKASLWGRKWGSNWSRDTSAHSWIEMQAGCMKDKLPTSGAAAAPPHTPHLSEARLLLKHSLWLKKESLFYLNSCDKITLTNKCKDKNWIKM